MKKVFSSNLETCHVYAQQSQERGESGSGNVFFEGKVMYSYGYHFPMAVFIDSFTIFLNSDSYSNSTSKQQSNLYVAIRSNEILYLPTNLLKRYISIVTLSEPETKFLKRLMDEWLKEVDTYYISQIQARLEQASRRRSESLKDSDIREAYSDYAQLEDIFEKFNKPMYKKSVEFMSKITDDCDSILESYNNKYREQQVRIKAKKQAYEDVIKAQLLPAWRDGVAEVLVQNNIAYRMFNSDKIYLRVSPNNLQEIETSQGAKFPVEEGLKAYSLAKHCISDPEYLASNKVDREALKVGYYTINKIDNKGNITAGCHYIEFDEIDRLGKQLSKEGKNYGSANN